MDQRFRGVEAFNSLLRFNPRVDIRRMYQAKLVFQFSFEIQPLYNFVAAAIDQAAFQFSFEIQQRWTANKPMLRTLHFQFSFEIQQMLKEVKRDLYDAFNSLLRFNNNRSRGALSK